ncbi:MAG: AbiH family protein, partial [Acutalibacteraceae bacterium]|nr:AbiH family protein [Acutalibacteraceae bacterium]
VIDCFKYFFKTLYEPFEAKKNVSFIPGNRVFKNEESKYIIMESFNFFIDNELSSKNGKYKDDIIIKEDFTCECPLKPGYFRIDKEKIIDYLYNQFQDFAYALKIYLCLFVDKTTELLCASSNEESSEQPEIPQMKLMEYSSVVISFNYTHTYELLLELLFQSSQIFFTPEIVHIHGETDEEIVLGVNSDKNDRKENVDTSFLRFKKYYQRTYYETDCSYLKWVSSLREKMKKDNDETVSENIKLSIMGHSLDVTDENYIRELFGLATSITVFYHNETAKKQHIENLVNIFGGNEFEKLRIEKQLSFVNLDYVT